MKRFTLKIAKKGFSVTNMDINKKKTSNDSKKKMPHLLTAVALTYFYGSKTQLKRYQIAVSNLDKDNAVNGTYVCLHEISSLFEDVNTVAKYMEECGYKNDLHQLWLDIRNHIRHDVREEFDNNDDSRKEQRALRLKLDPKLQMDISFEVSVIHIGGTDIKISQIEEYLKWSEDIMGKILVDAQNLGYINRPIDTKL